MKEEIQALKINFKQVLEVRAEFEHLEKSVKYVKEEIKQLAARNMNISERIKLVEEEIRYETDYDGDSDNDFNLPHLEAKQTNGKYLKKKGQELKCCKCGHVSNTEMSLKIYINTRHTLQNMEEEEISSKEVDYNLDGIESIENLFQLEFLDGDQIYACNVCDQGFDIENEIKKHIIDNHKEIINK